MQFRNIITGQLLTPSDWQAALQVGDYYEIAFPIAAAGDGQRFDIFDRMPHIYGQIESDEECQPGFFWVRAYSTDCPRGEVGSFNICEATRKLTREDFEAARARGWAAPGGTQ